jgi:type VI protein secretion system component Hcp
MNRVSPRLILAASALIASVGVGPALAEPAAPGPVPAPYPNVAAHKHIAGVKYEDVAKSDVSAATDNTAAGDQVIEVQSISWGVASDPEEGGQIAARKYAPGKPTYGNVTFNRAPAAAESKPKVSEIPITKQMDASSPKLMAEQPAEPGKLEYPNVQGTGVAAKTTATFTTLAGKCVKGKHLDKVTIVARSGGRYSLRDVIVTDVTPAGDGMETVSLTYASMDK